MNYEIKKMSEVSLRANSSRGRKSKYGPIAEKISRLETGQCVVIRCKENQKVETLRNTIHQSLKRHISGFKFSTKILDSGDGVAIFKKG